MSKKIEKEFWVSDYTFESMKSGCFAPPEQSNACKQKITITWEEPEKTITLSEREFDLKVKQIYDHENYKGLFETVKHKLFSKGDV